MGAEVRNQYAFISVLTRMMCAYMYEYVYMYEVLVLWSSHSYPRYSGGKVGLKCRNQTLDESRQYRRFALVLPVSLRGPWLLAGTLSQI